jgi:4-aminobutyrate aminotransferase-like enzyme
MLLSTDGPFHNVIKIKPPMVLTSEDVDMVVRCFGEELAQIVD